MPGPRFNEDEVPAFNDFGKPIIQPHAEGGSNCLCCAKCEQYLQCFKRAPLEVDFKGLDFSDWLEWAQIVWNETTTRYRQGDFTGDDPDGSSEFIGKFVLLPFDDRYLDCNGQGCFGQTEVEPDVFEGEKCRDACGTHYSPFYRTIHTPESPDWLNKRVSLFAYVTCCHVDDDPELASIGIKFGVMLQVEGETGTHSWGYNGSAWMWNRTGPYHRSAFCCPILATECILWEDLDPEDWSNLQEIPLIPQNFWWYDEGVEIEDETIVGCNFWHYGWWGFHGVCTDEDFDGTEPCELCTDEPTNDCPNGTLLGTVNGWTCDGDLVDVPICIPDPMRLLSATDNTISVLGNCQPKECTNCDPPTEWEGPKPPAREVRISFTTTGGCGKTFTAVYPDCITPATINWSWGAEGPTAFRNLNNLLEGSATEYGEIVTLTIIDDRGCVYTYCQIVTCDCCEVSGGISVEEDPEVDCRYKITASVSSTEDCPFPFIEIQYKSPVCPEFPDDCLCGDVTPDSAEPCSPCMFALGDGQFANLDIDGEVEIRYRIWDKECGCAGPWQELTLICTPCEHCVGNIYAVKATVGGVASNGACDFCLEVNDEYWLVPHPSSPCCWVKTVEDAFICSEEPIDVEVGVCILSCFQFGDPPFDSPLQGYIIAGGGSQHDRTIVDTDCPDIACDELSGNLPLTSFSNSVCDFSSATLDVEFLVS